METRLLLRCRSPGRHRECSVCATSTLGDPQTFSPCLKDACSGRPLRSMTRQEMSQVGGRSGFATVAVKASQLLRLGQLSFTLIAQTVMANVFGSLMREPAQEDGDAHDAGMTRSWLPLGHTSLNRRANR